MKHFKETDLAYGKDIDPKIAIEAKKECEKFLQDSKDLEGIIFTGTAVEKVELNLLDVTDEDIKALEDKLFAEDPILKDLIALKGLDFSCDFPEEE